MAATTTTPSSPRPADAIALPTNSPPKSCRSSASHRTPTAPNKDAPAARSSTSSPSPARITCTARRSTISATAPSARPIRSWRSSRTTASSRSEAPSAAQSSATRSSSSPDSISTSSTSPTSSNFSMAARRSFPQPAPDLTPPETTKPPIKPWSSPPPRNSPRSPDEYPAAQIGNSSYAKLDINLTPRHQLALRVNTTRYWGSNNVFLDPASPVTYDSISNNGEEVVATETAIALADLQFLRRAGSATSAPSSRATASSPSATPATCWSRFPPSSTASDAPIFFRARRASIACTSPKLSASKARAIPGSSAATACSPGSTTSSPASKAANIFSIPSRSIPSPSSPWKPDSQLTPLRAYAHEVPHYYLQNFGSATSHPDTNEYAAFAQDTIRVTNHLALNLGVRWDLQTFTTAGLLSNPLFPPSGKVPFQALQLRAARRIRLLLRQHASARRPRRIRHLLRPHSADLQLGRPDRKRHHRRQPLPQQYELLRSPGLPQLSQSAGELSALCRELRPARRIHARRHQRRLCVRPQFRDSARAAGQPHAGKRSRRPHHRRVSRCSTFAANT